MSNSPFAPQQRGTPLAALFLLIAVAAVLLGMLAAGLRSMQDWQSGWIEGVALAGGAALVLAVGGMVGGFFAFHRALAMTLGGLCGAAAGVMVSVIIFAGQDSISEITTIAIAGSVLIVLLAVGIRWQAGSRPLRW